MKPFGVYLLVTIWPATVTRQRSIALLAGLSGLSFGLLESSLYVFVYDTDQLGSNFALFRFTVPVALHVTASTIFGISINRSNLLTLARGASPARSFWLYPAAAMTLHAIYNIVVTVWNPSL